jgi:hypothetical protein
MEVSTLLMVERFQQSDLHKLTTIANRNHGKEIVKNYLIVFTSKLPVSIRSADLYRIENDIIVEHRDDVDQLILLQKNSQTS